MEEVGIKKIKLPSRLTVKKFAELLGLGISDVIKELMKNKILATIHIYPKEIKKDQRDGIY